jgi:hypothetical protein
MPHRRYSTTGAVGMHDLAIVVVSTNEAQWLHTCLSTVFEHAGSIDIDVVVADYESTDGTRELVETEFPAVRVVTCENRCFAHANNRGALTANARYVLFLNPDTEILGCLRGPPRTGRPAVGRPRRREPARCRRHSRPVDPALPERGSCVWRGAGLERFPVRGLWLGERELRMEV